MKMINTTGMTEAEFLEECYRKQFTYQDYLTNVEFSEFMPMSKQQFNGHMLVINERKHFATL